MNYIFFPFLMTISTCIYADLDGEEAVVAEVKASTAEIYSMLQ